MSDWWEEYVYLRGRSPLMVNSNFYGTDAILLQPTTKQSARAAAVIYQCLLFRRLIDRQELEPVCIRYHIYILHNFGQWTNLTVPFSKFL